jgi:hypothetical protein
MVFVFVLWGAHKCGNYFKTSILFFKSLHGLLIHVEKLLLAFCPSEWRLQKKQIPENFRLFGTFWTTMVENPSFSEWHFDQGEFGLTASLYFGNFSGGGTVTGKSFQL